MNASLLYGHFQTCPDVSGSAGMAEGSPVRAGSVRSHRGVPKQETYGLCLQMRRAAVSMPANIAEGHARGTRKDYAHFVSIARGSLAETETILLLLVDIELLTDERVQAALELCSETGRMLNALLARLRDAPHTRPLKPDP